MQQINDDYIIEFFSDKRGKINPNKTRQTYLDKYPEIKNYLENRYNYFISYIFTLKCIFNKLDESPKCLYCGKYLDHIGKYCNVTCEMNDPKLRVYINEVTNQEEKTKKFKQTCLVRYGVTAPAKNKDIAKKMAASHDYKKDREKAKQTNLKKYGVDHPMKLKSVKDKVISTKQQKENGFGQDKYRQTCLERYNMVSTLCNGEFREKGKLNRNTEEINKKVKQTKKERYGSETYNNSKQRKATCIQKYGTSSFSQTQEYNEKRKRKYEYDGYKFDSIPEVVFYIYHRDLGNDIKHEPCQFEYYYNGQKRIYNPDFEVNGELYEIKGYHFFRDGKMINPFDRSQDNLYEAKHQCMLNNNVNIIVDMTNYYEYVKVNYGNIYDLIS